jgi:hypothetical protein
METIVLNNIVGYNLPELIKKKVMANRLFRVIIEPIDDNISEKEEIIPISDINAASESFEFLKNEPDIYSISDLKKKYV